MTKRRTQLRQSKRAVIMPADAELYSLRKAMVATMWAWWRLYYGTNGGETADSATAYRLWALRQTTREARYAVLEARERHI